MHFKLSIMPTEDPAIDDWAARIARDVPGVEVAVADTIENAITYIADSDAAAGTVPPLVLAAAKKLRWIQGFRSSPAPGYFYPQLIEHPVVVTNIRGLFNDYLSEAVMMFILALSRGLQHYLPMQANHEWSPLPSGSVVKITDSTALVIGVGEAGVEVARLCAGFGMKVYGIDARRRNPCPGLTQLFGPESLDDLLPQADWVIMMTPHTSETEGMIDAHRFQLMKRTAFLINVGRGPTVKMDALEEALRKRLIAGAGIDVFEQEPLPQEHPLWDAPNVILTPHVMGCFGAEFAERCLQVLIANCHRFAAGQTLENIVDKAQGF